MMLILYGQMPGQRMWPGCSYYQLINYRSKVKIELGREFACANIAVPACCKI